MYGSQNGVITPADLLIIGNDLGVWVSIDGAESWHRLRANLPTVPVHDLTIHPRENDLVLGTYGRAVWVGDITLLRQLSAEILAKPFHLFEVEPRAFCGLRALGNFHLFGDRYRAAANGRDALVIQYTLATAVDGGARVTITDNAGTEIAALEGPAEVGLNRAFWDMRPDAPPEEDDWRSRMRRFNTRPLPPGDYRITVQVGDHEGTTIGTLRDRLR